MDRTTLRDYCLNKKGTTAEFPFGPEAEVFKVMGKMFALMPTDAQPQTISLKCDPTLADMLRQTYEAVIPGYHMNKRHWNTVTLDGSIPEDEVLEMIDHSYDLVVKGLTKAQHAKLINQN
ncbi:MAG: MmcQ/YjbR family DNA-binding protein [Anaerolineae bacterium]|nr:MmcQ/YjbR family DNA-binding protein [Anaerolineae bacterium]